MLKLTLIIESHNDSTRTLNTALNEAVSVLEHCAATCRARHAISNSAAPVAWEQGILDANGNTVGAFALEAWDDEEAAP